MAKQWYVIHTMAGFEERVKASIEEKVKTKGLEDKISRILIPTEKIIEVKGKKKKEMEKNTVFMKNPLSRKFCLREQI